MVDSDVIIGFRTVPVNHGKLLSSKLVDSVNRVKILSAQNVDPGIHWSITLPVAICKKTNMVG